MGTGQGSVISPLLGNIYLHYVFDLWAERWRRQKARGDMIVVRYADDLVAGFEHQDDARRFLDAMRERFEAFSLSLHPDKTRLIEFGRHAAADRKKRGVGRSETFAFLGFTFICGKSRRGAFQLQRKTRRDRMRAKLQEIKAELRQRMHQTIPDVDEAITQTIDNDSVLRGKRDLLLSIGGVGETLAGVVLAELPGPDLLRSSAEVVAYAGLNPRQHQSGASVDRATRISKIGNAVLRAALYMPALSAMRYNPAIVALATRLKSRGRLKPKQIVVAAMRKLLVLCFGVLKTGKPFDAAIAMGC